MPAMTLDTNLIAQGPIVEAHFAVSKELEDNLTKNGFPIPAPVKIKALIDTGATSCVVQADIPKSLGLSPIGKILISTASHSNQECYQYFMRLLINHPSGPLIYEGIFIAANLDGQDIHCLIGRDLLAYGIFIYIGYANQFTLALY